MGIFVSEHNVCFAALSRPSCTMVSPPSLQAKDSDLQRTVMMMKLKESRLARLTAGGWQGLRSGQLASCMDVQLASCCRMQHTLAASVVVLPLPFAVQAAAATRQRRWLSCSKSWSCYVPRWAGKHSQALIPLELPSGFRNRDRYVPCICCQPAVSQPVCWPAHLLPGRWTATPR